VLKEAAETFCKNEVKAFYEIRHCFLNQLGQAVEDIVEYFQGLEFQVQNLSLNDKKMVSNCANCEYIYAHKINDWSDYACP